MTGKTAGHRHVVSGNTCSEYRGGNPRLWC